MFFLLLLFLHGNIVSATKEGALKEDLLLENGAIRDVEAKTCWLAEDRRVTVNGRDKQGDRQA